jgi:CRP-like cAMP-binding protein
LEAVPLAPKQVIFEANGPIPHVYFPTDGVVSLVTYLEDGPSVEIATVGREGMVGLSLFLETATIAWRAFGQVPGEALRMRAGSFRDEVERNGAFVRLLKRYTQAMLIQVAQSSACNCAHTIEQRCARWLLQTHDRVGSDEYLLTQEFLAQMLGVRRSSVSQVAGGLQKAGLIRYVRGRITVLNRAGLEATSCECYGFIRGEFERLLGKGP